VEQGRRNNGRRDVRQLPPGRHGLSRAFVAQNQRDRILAAVTDVTSAASYAEMSVEDIVVTAGISRRTFYDHFTNKHEAFLAAYDAAADNLVDVVRSAYARHTTFPRRAGAGLAALLHLLAENPALARMCVVEVLAAGQPAIERRNRAMAAFARMLDRNARAYGARFNPPPLTAATILGGIYEVVYLRIVQGEIRRLPGLHPDLLYSMLVPYLGPEAAEHECDLVRNDVFSTPVRAIGYS
jgi:AcrR family transcriptional regulator